MSIVVSALLCMTWFPSNHLFMPFNFLFIMLKRKNQILFINLMNPTTQSKPSQSNSKKIIRSFWVGWWVLFMSTRNFWIEWWITDFKIRTIQSEKSNPKLLGWVVGFVYVNPKLLDWVVGYESHNPTQPEK